MQKIILIVLLVLIILVVFKKSVEKFCLDKTKGLEYESFYNKGYSADELYKGSMKEFLNKVEQDKEQNNSILGSIQNPLSDRNHNTRILYQPPEEIYKF